jgi:hypothetical protein
MEQVPKFHEPLFSNIKNPYRYKFVHSLIDYLIEQDFGLGKNPANVSTLI